MGAVPRAGALLNVVRYPVVLFDLDGTLIDSGAMILASFRHATRAILEREFTDAELLAAVGGTTLHEQMRALDPDRAEEFVRSYREHNHPLHTDLQAFPGLLELLDRLDAGGRTLGIVTSKRRATVDLAFEVLPLERHFDVVVTTEATARHKPNPDPLLHAAERLRIRPRDCAYVGDAPFDVVAAKAAGMAAIAVTWGGIHSRERLVAEEPDALAATPDELFDVL